MSEYIHLIGGYAYGVAHEPGDPVSPRVPKGKLKEWLAAGIIEATEDEGEDLES